MATEADNEQIAKFREDAKFLLDLYTNAGMDKRLGFKGNLSGYVNGHKNPSIEKIELFYEVYGKDLEKYDRQVPENIINETREPYGGYAAEIKSIKDDLSLIKTLLVNRRDQQDIAELRSRLEKIENRLFDNETGSDKENTSESNQPDT